MIPPTEQRNPRSSNLGSSAASEVITLMDDEDRHALDAVTSARDAIVRAVGLVADAYGNGHRVAYVATGSSGILAAMDAAELPPTFGVDAARYLALVTSTPSPAAAAMRGASEDDTTVVPGILDALGFGAGDVVIGIAASGTTPLVVAGAHHARAIGCRTVGIANNPGTPLLDGGDIGVLLDTGPEVLTGSTRLKAGTAQKLALNRISTAAMVALGRVTSNLMVELRPGNDKLRERGARIVAELTGTTIDEARERLVAHDWSVRDAILDTAR